MVPRREPFHEMRRIHAMLDRVMDDSVTGTNEWYAGLAPIDLYQTDDEIVMEAPMPGVTESGLSASITWNTERGMSASRAGHAGIGPDLKPKNALLSDL